MFGELFLIDSIKNDTAINAKSYTKLFYVIGTAPYYIGGYRNDTANKKTFFIPSDSTQEFLLYDFSANAGDTIKKVITRIFSWPPFPIQYATIDLRVDSVTYKIIGPRNHKRIYLYNITASWFYSDWIEKIGSREGIIDYSKWQGPACCLQCMSFNDTIYYYAQPPTPPYNKFPYTKGRCDTVNLLLSINTFPSKNNIEIYPSPVTNYLSIDFARSVSYPVQINIYNFIGDICKTFLLHQPSTRIDISDFPNGIYFLLAKNQNDFYKSQKFIKQ